MTVPTLPLLIPGTPAAKALRAKTDARLTEPTRTTGAKPPAPREFRAELGETLREDARRRGGSLETPAVRDGPNDSRTAHAGRGDSKTEEGQPATLDRAMGEGERTEAPPDHPSRAQDQSQGSERASKGAEAGEQVEVGDAAKQTPMPEAKADTASAGAVGEPAPPENRGGADDRGPVVAVPVDATRGTPLTIRELTRALRGLDRSATPAAVLRDLGIDPAGIGADGVAGTDQSGPSVPVSASMTSAEAAQGADRRSAEHRQSDQPRPERDSVDDEAGAPRGGERPASVELAGAAPLRSMSDATAVAERDAAGTEARVAPAGSVSTAAATPGHAVRSGLDRAGVFTASSPMLLRHSDDAEGLEAQVARGLVAALGQRGAAGSGAVTLRLSPESLGPLRIELDVQGASVMVRFVAQSVGVAERIDRAMPILRATLDAAGLELRGATTQVNAEARSDGGVQDHGRGDGGGRNGAATHGGGGAETPNVTDGRREPGSDREDVSRGGVRRGVRSTDRGVDREGDIGVVRAEPVRFSGVDGALVLGVDTLA